MKKVIVSRVCNDAIGETEKQLTQDNVDKRVEEIIEKIENTENEQSHIIEEYATLLYHKQSSAGRDFRWPVINKAIIERWSLSGLERIKEAAWAVLDIVSIIDEI